MRVVGGKLRGKRLGQFKGTDIRPTTDRVREALFNILGTRVDLLGARVLDLFAGTGAVGIEALSRGAAEAWFVDSDPAAIKVIGKNIKACGLEDSAHILTRDAVLTVKGLSRRPEGFDLIFLDPPYSCALLEEVISEVALSGLLAPGGLLVAETSKRAPLVIGRTEFEGGSSAPLSDEPESVGAEVKPGTVIGSLCADEVRTYGDTLLYLFSTVENVAPDSET